MGTIRPEVTGRGPGVTTAGIGHNGGPPLEPAYWVELQRIVDLKEASRLSGLSVDSIKRHHSDKIIDLSPRRRGMRVRDALMLADKEED
jgi:hypothetical protein